MLKGLGLCLLVLCGVGTGWLGVLRLRQERAAWLLLCRMLREMAVQMEYRSCTTGELLEQLAEEPAYAMFRFPTSVSQGLLAGDAFSSAWRKGLTEDDAVPEQARQQLLPLGEELGASDLNGQLATLEQYRQQLEPAARESDRRYSRLGRLYGSLGALGGLLAAILLV